MPVAKPDKVVVHRIELQQTELALLQQYIDQQNDGVDDPKLAALKILSNGSSGFFIASGVLIAVPIGFYAYARWKTALLTALNSLDPAQALDELKEKLSTASIATELGIKAGINESVPFLGLPKDLADIWNSLFGDDDD